MRLRCRGGRWRLDLGFARRTGLYLLDQHLLGAAMAEVLAHDALLDAARFQRQRLVRADAQLLFASLFCRFSHSAARFPGFQDDYWCRSGSARGALRAPEMPRFRDPQPGLNVPHLPARMPNPIAKWQMW